MEPTSTVERKVDIMKADSIPDETLGARLGEAREYTGFSEEEVARHLGLSRTEISSIERGLRHVTESEIHRLAALYRTRVEVLTGSEQGEPGWESFPDLDQAAADLPDADRNEVLRFARFLSTWEAGTSGSRRAR